MAMRKKSKNNKSDSKVGLVQEVSQLVREIEATLRVHENARGTAEDNPLTNKRNKLQEKLEILEIELAQVIFFILIHFYF